MTVRLFALGSLFGALVSWTIVVFIIRWLDPVEAGVIEFVLFFLAMFMAMVATSSLFGYLLRRMFVSSQLPTYSVRPALRQGLLLAAFTDALLFLQLLRLLRWWLTVITIVLFLFIELVFLNYDRSVSRDQAAESGS